MTRCAISSRSRCSAASRACWSPRPRRAMPTWPILWRRPRPSPARSNLPPSASAPPRISPASAFAWRRDWTSSTSPYPGPGQALADLTAGRVDFYFIPVTPALPLISEGRVVPLAVSTPHRLQSLSGSADAGGSGLPAPPYLTWCGLSAPANTPRNIVDQAQCRDRKSARLSGSAKPNCYELALSRRR